MNLIKYKCIDEINWINELNVKFWSKKTEIVFFVFLYGLKIVFYSFVRLYWLIWM